MNPPRDPNHIHPQTSMRGAASQNERQSGPPQNPSDDEAVQLALRSALRYGDRKRFKERQSLQSGRPQQTGARSPNPKPPFTPSKVTKGHPSGLPRSGNNLMPGVGMNLSSNNAPAAALPVNVFTGYDDRTTWFPQQTQPVSEFGQSQRPQQQRYQQASAWPTPQSIPQAASLALNYTSELMPTPPMPNYANTTLNRGGIGRLQVNASNHMGNRQPVINAQAPPGGYSNSSAFPCFNDDEFNFNHLSSTWADLSMFNHINGANNPLNLMGGDSRGPMAQAGGASRQTYQQALPSRNAFSGLSDGQNASPMRPSAPKHGSSPLGNAGVQQQSVVATFACESEINSWRLQSSDRRSSPGPLSVSASAKPAQKIVPSTGHILLIRYRNNTLDKNKIKFYDHAQKEISSDIHAAVMDLVVGARHLRVNALQGTKKGFTGLDIIRTLVEDQVYVSDGSGTYRCANDAEIRQALKEHPRQPGRIPADKNKTGQA